MKKFFVEYRIETTSTTVIEAESIEEARKLANQAAADDGFDEVFDSVDDVQVNYLAELVPVMRDGKKISTTYVLPTDVRI